MPQQANAQPKTFASVASDAVAVAEEQQREGVEQVEGRGLAEEVHRQRAVAAGAQQRHQPPQQQVAQRQDQRDPPRDDVAQGEADDDREDVEPVGDRVEDLAELRGLVELAGEVAVEVVGDAREHQQDQRPAVGLGPEDQPQEERDAGQPDHAEQVGHGPHAAGARWVVLHCRLHPRVRRRSSRRARAGPWTPPRRRANPIRRRPPRRFDTGPTHGVPGAIRRLLVEVRGVADLADQLLDDVLEGDQAQQRRPRRRSRGPCGHPRRCRVSSASWRESAACTGANGRIHLGSIGRPRRASSVSRTSLMWR